MNVWGPLWYLSALMALGLIPHYSPSRSVETWLTWLDGKPLTLANDALTRLGYNSQNLSNGSIAIH